MNWLSLGVIGMTSFVAAFTGAFSESSLQEPESISIVFLNSTEIVCCDPDDNELWRFESNEGKFFRNQTSQSRLAANSDFIYVATDTSILALDIGNGEKRWSHEFAKPSDLATCAQIVTVGDRVLVTVNQISAPMVCLDNESGEIYWSYPGKDSGAQLGFGPLAVNEGTVLFHATVSTSGQRGYQYENQAINLLSGETVEWPVDLADVPLHMEEKRVTSVFDGESLAPVQDGEIFTGVLGFSEANGFYFERPEFYSDRPLYKFETDAEEKFRGLIDTKVKISGKVISVMESLPPIIVVKAFEIDAFE